MSLLDKPLYGMPPAKLLEALVGAGSTRESASPAKRVN